MLVNTLRELLARDGRTIADVARAMKLDDATLGRWFSGKKQNLRQHEIEGVCKVLHLDADHPTTVYLVELAEAARHRGFTQRSDWMGQYRFDAFLRLEHDSRHVDTYQAAFVPGLLQTPDYAEAVIRVTVPDVTEAGVSERVALRMERQNALRRPHNPVELHAIIDQAVITRRLGDQAAWLAQLRHLATAAEWPNVTLQVIPFDVGPHEAGATGSFVLFGLDDVEQVDGGFGAPIGPIGYQETTITAIWAEVREEAKLYRDMFGRLAVRAADPTVSLDLVAQAIMALR